MKKLTFVVIGLAILSGGLLFSRKEEKGSSQAGAASDPKNVTSNQRLFRGRRTKKLETIEAKDGCSELQARLDDIDFNQKDIIGEDALRSCPVPEFQARMNLVLKHCYEKKSTECEVHQVFLRSMIRTRGISDSDEKEVIADLILKEFAHNQPDMKKLEKLTAKLLRDDPKNPVYQKMWATSKFISSGDPRKQREGLKEEILSEVDPETLNAPDMEGLRIYLETGLDPAKVEAVTRGLLQQDPSRPFSREILGWSLWQQGRREEALAQLAQAVTASPKDQWLRDMYENLQKPEATKEDYMGRLNLGVNTEDLFR